jgi:hypothetical protein
MPQIALQRLIQEGIKHIKDNPAVLDEILEYYKCEWAADNYGEEYIQQIKTWFVDTKIPVVQAWSINAQLAPQLAVRLASEQEDISKTAMGDQYFLGEDAAVGMTPFTVKLEILIMTTKNSDQTLWLYYIILYLLFKFKFRAREFGLQLQTFSASDHVRDMMKLADNIWTRSIMFSTTVQHTWDDRFYLDIDDLDLTTEAESNDINNSQKVKL